jgi:hypothetical protein
MTIHDYEVPEEVVLKCEAVMMRGAFRANEITAVAIQAGVPESIEREYVACRVADRLIQKHRKAKTIRMSSTFPVWEPTP